MDSKLSRQEERDILAYRLTQAQARYDDSQKECERLSALLQDERHERDLSASYLASLKQAWIAE
jgi:hypothetical protein